MHPNLWWREENSPGGMSKAQWTEAQWLQLWHPRQATWHGAVQLAVLPRLCLLAPWPMEAGMIVLTNLPSVLILPQERCVLYLLQICILSVFSAWNYQRFWSKSWVISHHCCLPSSSPPRWALQWHGADYKFKKKRKNIPKTMLLHLGNH